MKNGILKMGNTQITDEIPIPKDIIHDTIRKFYLML